MATVQSFYQSGRSAFIGSGHDNIVKNNVFVEYGRLYPEDKAILTDLKFEKIPFDSSGLYTDEFRHSLQYTYQLV